MVVDDDPACRRVVERALQVRGWSVTAVASGKAAMAVFEAGDYGLLVCDVNLGDMDGIVVARRLSAARPGLRVLIVSGLAENLERARIMGFKDRLCKPFPLEDLWRLVAANN